MGRFGGRFHGTVYFIQSGAGAIKIGTAKNVARRIATLRLANPEPLTLLHTMPGGVTLEHRLHRKFAALRIRGEWFRAEDPLLSWLRNGAIIDSAPLPEMDEIATRIAAMSFLEREHVAWRARISWRQVYRRAARGKAMGHRSETRIQWALSTPDPLRSRDRFPEKATPENFLLDNE